MKYDSNWCCTITRFALYLPARHNKATKLLVIINITPKFNYMKKIALLLSICVLSITMSSGQGIRFGLLVGPNWSTFVQTQPGQDETSTVIFGGHAGLFTEFTFGNLSVGPALFYTAAGGKSYFATASDGGITTSAEYTVQYLQVPVNILYNTPGRKFFFGGGPYIGFGLSGNVSDNTTTYTPGFPNTPESSQEKYIFSKANNPDYGLNFVAGAHLTGGTIFTIGYGLGFRYSTYAYNDATVRNDVFSISIGHTIF